jgi:hypothetical protein
MKNLNRWEIANHINTSVKETYPVDREVCQPVRNVANIPTTGEFASRHHISPEVSFRDDRSFTQSLWGRR